MKDSMLENLLKTIADITGETDGAFNLRKDGVGVIRHSTENIEIKSKEDNSQSESCSKEMICAPVKEASAS